MPRLPAVVSSIGSVVDYLDTLETSELTGEPALAEVSACGPGHNAERCECTVVNVGVFITCKCSHSAVCSDGKLTARLVVKCYKVLMVK